jgi:flagellar basal-body rod modification protein FlgD
MAVTPTMPSPVVSAPGTNNGTSNTTSSTTTAGLANNFQTFLTLLTTQLQNQNPLDPLDTNQFTSQLVQFAQVEQQLKQNEQLTALINLEKTASATQALGFVGRTVSVDGSTAAFNGSATWNLNAAKDAKATITITNSVGQTVYTGDYNVTAGNMSFVWDGKGNDGTQWPSGNYKISATAKDNSGNSVGIATEVQGVVTSVDMTESPALLMVGGQTYTVDKVKRVVATAAN